MSRDASLKAAGSNDTPLIEGEVVPAGEEQVTPIATPEQVDNAVRFFAALLQVHVTRRREEQNGMSVIEH